MVDFLSSVLHFCEKGDPLPVAFSKAKSIKRVRNVDYDELLELSRKLILSYYALEGKSARKKVTSFLNKGSKVSLPPWMSEELKELIDLDAYLKSAELGRYKWFRVNRLLADEDDVLSSLETQGIKFERDKDFNYLFRVISGNITKTKEFDDFKIIVQDKASVAVVQALGPEKGDVILELASAPGLKAELVYELTQGDVYLILAELDLKRLDKEIKLLSRLGVDLGKVDFINQDSTKNSVLKVDKVLIDAPCSSSGIFYKEPTVLLTLRDRDKVENFSKLQKLMIKEAFNISFKKAVYSVCSIFPEEGEVIMDEYVDKLMTTDVGGIEGYGKYKSGKLSRRYFGHIHGTEDFFIATLRGVS